MRQINFLMIFAFGLTMVYFTLENTAPTTVQFFPGVTHTFPLAPLLLMAGGMGAFAAWFFATWSGISRNVDTISNVRIELKELEASQVRIQELETDIDKYRSSLSILPVNFSTDQDAETNSAAAADGAEETIEDAAEEEANSASSEESFNVDADTA